MPPGLVLMGSMSEVPAMSRPVVVVEVDVRLVLTTLEDEKLVLVPVIQML